MKILVLHSRLSGYWMACMQRFVDVYGGQFTVIRQRQSPQAPFDFSSTDSISLHQRDSFTDEELKDFCVREEPDLVYVAGWSYKAYLAVAKYYYGSGVPILCGMDNQWNHTFRQKLGFIYLKNLLKRRFTHIWIPGLYQFETARKLGFPKERILTGVYSADVPLFSEASKKSPKNYPKSFLFLGRLIPRKGLSELMEAFGRLREQINSDWSLTVVGNGAMSSKIKQFSGINHIDFLQPHKLPGIMHKHGVFVAPSRSEPWGVVIHEAAAAGMPIISTPQCGAATAFVRNGYNGYLTEAGSVESLFEAMKSITQKESSDLSRMGKRSAELSRQYTPQTWSSTLFQLIQSYQ